MESILNQALAYVEQIFAGDSGGHDYFHTLRVYRTALRIAQEEGADVRVVSLAALLHDVDDRKLSPETAANKDNARKFLSDNGVSPEETERIIHIIQNISFGDSAVPDSLEGECVQDADRLDAIGAVGIGRAFAFGGSRGRLMHDPNIQPKLNMTAEEYRRSESTTVNHFYEKLLKLKDTMHTPTAKKIAEDRHTWMCDFLEEFLREWDGLK